MNCNRRGPSACAASALKNWKASAPRPPRPAISIVSSAEHATHNGGCGFCIGLGTTLRSGKSKEVPWYSQPPSLNIGMTARTASSRRCRALLVEAAVERLEFGDAGALAHAEFGTRPRLTRSSAAIRSATRRRDAAAVSCMMPCARRIWRVCAGWPRRGTPPGPASANIPRGKWCSTSQAKS